MSGVVLLQPVTASQASLSDKRPDGNSGDRNQAQNHPFYGRATCRFRRKTLISNAASSPSPSISGSPDQLLDALTERKRRKIAGIDQDDLLEPADLADPDSCFCEFQGVRIHHKVYDAQSQVDETSHGAQSSAEAIKIGFPMILLHGFGASVFSWNRVLKPLARHIGSKVLAFDRPAFGLTSRVTGFSTTSNSKPLNPYSMMFSVLATLYFIDSLAVDKAILVGHSAGSLVAVNTYFEAPERVAALILVAPAIFAPLAARRDGGGKDNTEGRKTDTSNIRTTFTNLLRILSQFFKFILKAINQALKAMADMLNLLYKKALLAVLRSSLGVMLVRMAIDKFGIAAVINAWYDRKRVTEHILNGYTKPLRAKGWDRALAEFTAAMLLDNDSDSRPPIERRLHEITCPVLIITGDTDRIVPSWNAERLSKVIPGSSFELIKQCGHLPQEEKPEEFVSVVVRFLQRAFGGLEEECLQAVT